MNKNFKLALVLAFCGISQFDLFSTISCATEISTKKTELAGNFQAPRDDISIAGDKMEFKALETGSEIKLHGNISIKMPQISISCDSVQVLMPPSFSGFDTSSIKSISAEGNIHITQEERTFSANKAEIDVVQHTAILEGDVTIKDKLGSLSGSKVKVDYVTKSFEILCAEEKSKPIQINTSLSALKNISTESSGALPSSL